MEVVDCKKKKKKKKIGLCLKERATKRTMTNLKMVIILMKMTY